MRSSSTGSMGVEPERLDGLAIEDSVEDHARGCAGKGLIAGRHLINKHTAGKQVRREEVEARTHQRSCGVVFYETPTGDQLWRGGTSRGTGNDIILRQRRH